MRKLAVMISLPIGFFLANVALAQNNNALILTKEKAQSFSTIEPIAAPAPTVASTTVPVLTKVKKKTSSVPHQSYQVQHHYTHAHAHHTHHHHHAVHSASHQTHPLSNRKLQTVASQEAKPTPVLLTAPPHVIAPVKAADTSLSSSTSTPITPLALTMMTARSTNLIVSSTTRKYVVSSSSNQSTLDASVRYLHPFLTISGGVASTYLGKTLNFSAGDLDYSYQPSNRYKMLGVVGIGAGDELRFDHGIRWAVGLSYYKEASTRVSGQLSQGADALTTTYYRYHYTVASQQVFLENKVLFNYAEYFYPYVSFGMGESFNKAYQYSSTASPYETYTPTFSSKTISSIAWILGAGVDANLTSHIRFGVGYRFSYLGPVSLNDGRVVSQVATTNLPYKLKQSSWRMNTVLAQLTYIIR